jgi:hypothetical protein
MNKNKLTKFFSSGLGLLILGFVLTTLCGGLVNEMHTRSTWKRDKRFELLKGELAKHEELLSDLTKVVGARVFRLQRVVWLLDPAATPAPETWQLNDDAQKELKTRWETYYQTVVDWNVNYRTYAIKIRILAGPQMAERFIVPDVVSGARKAKSGTLCGVIEETHKTVADLRAKAILTSRVDRAEHELAQHEVDHLYDAVDDFVRQLYQALGEKERSDDPISSGSFSGLR